MSVITPLPTPPSTSDPTNFASEADAFLSALPTFATEMNDFAEDLNNISTTATSTTSNAVGTGSKAFTVETGKGFFAGQSLTIARTAAPTNRMFTVADSYDSVTGALVVTSQAFEGAGTFTDWTITLGFNGVIAQDQLSTATQDSLKASIIGDSRNLVVTNNSATPNSQMDIDADEVILKNSSGNSYLAESVNLTADIATSGANGLDTGAEANSTWYYLWVIYNGTTVASLISASSTSPTLPSGYTYKALVGAVYNGSGGDFIKMVQHGRKAFSAWQLVTNTLPTTSYVSISLAAYVPPNAKSVLITIFGFAAPSANPNSFVAPNAADDLSIVSKFSAGTGSGSGCSIDIEAPITTAQTVYYKRGATAFANYEFNAHGWTI